MFWLRIVLKISHEGRMGPYKRKVQMGLAHHQNNDSLKDLPKRFLCSYKSDRKTWKTWLQNNPWGAWYFLQWSYFIDAKESKWSSLIVLKMFKNIKANRRQWTECSSKRSNPSLLILFLQFALKRRWSFEATLASEEIIFVRTLQKSNSLQLSYHSRVHSSCPPKVSRSLSAFLNCTVSRHP